ncbi:hypothetical protein HEQ72_05395 [Haematospirillum sp. 15-248]|uniref:DUF6362 family protein n=1 Tax=Haematospirillum sp. 15-248 TaxID=2723107 RepID=UPI00143B4549|nr:DUF6362 family protein [Haematospirillum sp. 15-248]NKD87738.1 hypothetical protein [Haematospirillum sp. 15-248]
MHEVKWTPSLVEERLAEAADVLKRLPEVKVRGYFNTWPRMVDEFSDLVGQEPPKMRRPWPQPAAITRMEETLSWTFGLDPVDAKIVWLRAGGDRWKTICWKVGLARAAANEHWLYALCVIAWQLNGKQHRRNVSKRRVIDETRAALG